MVGVRLLHFVPGEPHLIRVAAGILVDGDRILVCQRPRSDPYGLEWEFPGGKIERGESLEACLRRELAEELAIDADVGREVYRLRHRYPDRFVEVTFFVVASFRGTIRNQVFESIAWSHREDLSAYNFLEADRKLVALIARGEIV